LDMIKLAGPLNDDSGSAGVGSLYVLRSASRIEVEAFLTNEPYFKAGIFAVTHVHRWRHALPESRTGQLQEEIARARMQAA